MKGCILFILLLSFLFSCSSSDTVLEEALERSGSNRSELEKVLFYYENDALKLRAAHFLIENMPGHYTWGSPQLAVYRANRLFWRWW